MALQAISFDALPGQIYGLLGPNGAGKTTVLRILSTVLRPTQGIATVNGFDVVTQPSLVRQQIGFMSANTAVYDRMTAWEMVEYFGRLYGLEAHVLAGPHGDDLRPPADERDPRRAGLEDVDRHEAEGVDRPGDRARSAGADLRRGDRRAGRAGGPRLAQDRGRAARPRQVRRLLHAHHARGGTLCDRIAIMHRGHILAEGTLDELLEIHQEEDLEELFFGLISKHDEHLMVTKKAS